MSETKVQINGSDQASLIQELNNSNNSNLSIESLALLINIERLHFLESKITTEFHELKERQERVSFLNKLTRAINRATANDELDFNNNAELKEMVKKAKDLGVDINENKFKYNKEDRERLIENVRLTIDDYNVLNDMQLQTVTRLMTERYESYQLARAIMKPLHDDKISKARAAGGR